MSSNRTTSRRTTSDRTTSRLGLIERSFGNGFSRTGSVEQPGSENNFSENNFSQTAGTNCEDEPTIFSLRTPSPSSLRARTCTSQKGFSTQIVQRKGSVARNRRPAAIGFGLPTRPLFSTPDEVFSGNHTARGRILARIGTNVSYGNLLAAHTVASPSCFLCLYCRRFRTSCVHCFGDRFDGTARPLVRPPFLLSRGRPFALILM